MNVESANTIPMRKILSKLGIKPVAKSHTELLYQSPFHKSHEPRFVVNLKTNTWTDLNDNSSGDVIAFVCRHLKYYEEAHTIFDAERWLKNIFGYVPLNIPDGVPSYKSIDVKYRYEDHQHIHTPYLVEYLEKERCIPLDVAKYVLVEVTVLNKSTDNTFLALGIRTENNSYSIRNQNIKAQLKKPFPSFIRGANEARTGIHIFKDVFDYLSAITLKGKAFNDDVIILNSYAAMPLTVSFLFGYKRVYTWLDNTKSGMDATRAYNRYFRNDPDVVHKHMYKMFSGYTCLNAWLVANQSLAPSVEGV